MSELNLPIFKDDGGREKVLSMDDYVRFVKFNLEHLVDIKFHRVQKQKERVQIPFRL